MNRLKQVDLIYMKRSRYKLNIAIGIITVLLALAFGCSFGVYYKQYNQLFRIYTELYTKHTTFGKNFVCENTEPYPTYRIITKVPKQMLSQNQVVGQQVQQTQVVQSLNASSNTTSFNATSSNTLLQRLQAEEQADEEQEEYPEAPDQSEPAEQEFEYFTKILQIKPILKDLVLENLHTNDENYSNYYQQLITKYGQMTSIEQIDSSKIDPDEIDNVLMITSAGSLEYTNFTNYHEQEEQLLKTLNAVGLKPDSKIDIPKDVTLKNQTGCGIPYSPALQSILIDGDVHLPIRIKGNVKANNIITNTIDQNTYQGDIVVEGSVGNITISEGVDGNIVVSEGSVAGNISIQEGVSGNIVVQEGSVGGNIAVQKGVSGNITISETGVGGKIHIMGNVGENITATDDDTTNEGTVQDSVIYIKGDIKGYKKGIYVGGDINAKHGAIHVVGNLISEEGNVTEFGGIFAITSDATQRANAFVVHNTIEVSDNGIAILNNESKENAFIFGQRTINLTNNQYSSLSKYNTEKNDAYKYVDYKPRGFFVNGSLIGCNNNSSFSGLAIHVRGDLKAPYGAVFNKSFEGASTNGATALSIGGQLKGYWNSLSTKSILLIEEEAGVEECLQNEDCVQELYLQRIYRVCTNIGKQYNIQITEEECTQLHNINTGVVEVLGGIRTVAGNGISVNGDINCKGSNGKGITVSGKVIGQTQGISVGDVQVNGGKGVSIKSIQSSDRALHVNGDISSSKEGVYIKGDITANKNVLYVDGNINGMSNQALFVSGDITLNNSFERTNKVVWIKGGIGTKEPDNIAQGAGIALQVDGDIQCGDSAVIINGGVKAFGFRSDQPENEPNYGIKLNYVDVGYNWTKNPNSEVVQGPYGIHVGWINSFNTSINITNENHTQKKNITNENGVEEQTIILPAIQTNYSAINIGGDIEGYARFIKLTEQQKNEISNYTFDTDAYKQTLNAIKQSFEYNLVSIDGDIKADINTYNNIKYITTYQDGSNTTHYEPIYHTPKILLSTKGLYSSMSHSRTDGIQINGDIKAANGITVVGNITSSLTTSGGTSFNESFVDTVKAYVKIKGSLYQHTTGKQGPNGIVVGGVIRAKNSHGFYIANSNKKVDGPNTIEAGLCISVNGGNLVASTVSNSSSSQHVIQIWSGDIIVEESMSLEEVEGENQEEVETHIKTYTIPSGTYTTQQLLDELVTFNSAIGLNIDGDVKNLRKGIGVRLVGDVIAQSNAIYVSGKVKTDYQGTKLDKGVSYGAIYVGKVESNWNGINIGGDVVAEKIGIAVKGVVKQTGDHERCYYDCLGVDNGTASNATKANCNSCRNQTNYKNIIDDEPAAISVQSVESTGIGYGIHVFEYVKTNNDSIKVSGLKQVVCDSSEKLNTSDKLNTSICSNANGININGTIYAGETGIELNGSFNSSINYKINNQSFTAENGTKYNQYYYENKTTAIQAETGINIHGMINTTETGIKLNGMTETGTESNKETSYSYFLNSSWFNTSSDPDTLLNTTTKHIPYVIKGKVGLDIHGLINTSEVGIQLEKEETKTSNETYGSDASSYAGQSSYNVITSGLTAIQINGDLNSTNAATTINISGTVYNGYYLEYYQRCLDEREVITTSTKDDDEKENITAVYIKKIDTIENKVYHYTKSEIDGTGNQGRWCYNISKGAYGLMVDEIQSINTSVMLANNITSIGYKSNAIYINNGTYLYGRHGALQIGSCSTLRADDWDPLSMVYVGFINNNLTNGQWSVYMDGIYTNKGDRVITIDLDEYNSPGICAENPIRFD